MSVKEAHGITVSHLALGLLWICVCRDASRFVASQWETALLCNDVSHWLGASLESALVWINSQPFQLTGGCEWYTTDILFFRPWNIPSSRVIDGDRFGESEVCHSVGFLWRKVAVGPVYLPYYNALHQNSNYAVPASLTYRAIYEMHI